jgi:hypothetical protein
MSKTTHEWLSENAGPWQHDDGTPCPHYYASSPDSPQGYSWWS